MEAKEVLEKAQQLYNGGKWEGAIDTIEKNSKIFTNDTEVAEAGRLLGWSYYYLGIKGTEEGKRANLLLAEGAFKAALGKIKEGGTKISVMNGLPLVIWILGRKGEAWQLSDSATKEFPDEPSVWNTRSIFCRWAKKFEESTMVCEKVYETALAKEDYRTAGHGKHNKADALKELGRIDEARQEYNKALELYKKFEEITGQSAQFHIEGVKKKLSTL